MPATLLHAKRKTKRENPEREQRTAYVCTRVGERKSWSWSWSERERVCERERARERRLCRERE